LAATDTGDWLDASPAGGALNVTMLAFLDSKDLLFCAADGHCTLTEICDLLIAKHHA
jgi:hypothetical protein